MFTDVLYIMGKIRDSSFVESAEQAKGSASSKRESKGKGGLENRRCDRNFLNMYFRMWLL